MPPGRYQGCRRGIFGLRDWSQPLTRPQIWANETNNSSSQLKDIPDNKEKTVPMTTTEASSGQTVYKDSVVDNASIQSTVSETEFSKNQSLLVKFSYTSNPESPLNCVELSVTQKEKVIFLNYHPDNKMWINVKKSDSQEGYIPANYAIVFEEKVTELPWLKKEVIPQEKAEYKPYVSAYAKKSEASGEKEKFYCDICERGFNGPQPYKAHMVSKAHKEEVEAQAEYS